MCSTRTMYRILEAEHGCVKERRSHVQRPKYVKPELLATEANQVWSWDITKLKGPVKWTYFYLYVIMDIFSRYVVGWMIAQREQLLWPNGLSTIVVPNSKSKPSNSRFTLTGDRV